MTDYSIETSKAGRPDGRAGGGGRLIAAAAGFVVFYLTTAFLPNLASSPLPLPDDPAEQARTANFVTGGTMHVLALGIFVLLASRIPGFGQTVHVFAYVAAVPALVSVVSLVWFNGSVFILLGRLLCMIWIVIAAFSVNRRLSETPRADQVPGVFVEASSRPAPVPGRSARRWVARTVCFGPAWAAWTGS